MSADLNNDLLLLTAASGKQIGALLPLLSRWKRLRLAVHSDSSVAKLSAQYPAAEVVQTDLYSSISLRSLMKDVNVVIHVGPPFHAHEADIGIMMVDAAAESYKNGSGPLKHFIFSSVIGTQIDKMIHHAAKRRVELHLIESELPYTILQPSTFIDNIPIAHLLEEQVYNSPWDTGTKFSLTTLRDHADAMYRVLLEREEHFYAQYPVISTHDPTSFSDVLSAIETELGKKITIKPLEENKAVDLLLGRASGSDAYAKDAVRRMARYYDKKGLVGNSNILEMVIRRKPMQVAEWAQWAIEQAGGANKEHK